MTDRSDWQQEIDWIRFIETVPIPIMIFNLDGLMVAMNTFSEAVWQFPRELFIGEYNILHSPASVATGAARMFERVQQGEMFITEPALYDTSNMLIDHPNNRLFWVQRTVFPIYNAAGTVAFVGMIHRDASEEIERQQKVEAQQSIIRTLSTPIIQLWAGIVLVPLVGAIDRSRGVLLMEQLLEALVRYQSEIVIIDFTGVPEIDMVAATTILQLNRAVQLIGASIVLTGISAAIAQMLVQVDVNFSDITMRSSLQNGLEWSLHQLGLRVSAAK